MVEEWRKVKGTYGMLEVSNLGNVRSLLRGEPYILKQQYDRKGYKRIRFCLHGTKKTYKIHRLVAETFIDNPNNYPQVNHKDGYKDNNKVTNLEWCTNRQNADHAIAMGLWDNLFIASAEANEKRKIPVTATKKKMKVDFDSIATAEKIFDKSNIGELARNHRTFQGWEFELKEKG